MAPNTALKTLLFARGLTQRWLSGQADIHQSRLSQIIRGHWNATDDEKKAIAKALKVPIDQIFLSEVTQ